MSLPKPYQEFLDNKSQSNLDHGFEPIWMPDFLFGFQRKLVDWAIRKGRAAIFADCGLGKTPMQLVWAENVCRKTSGKVLIITPLAVSAQTIREADKFNIEAMQSREGKIRENITVTNYEQLHKFDSTAFTGVVCDESSAIKQFGGKRRKEVIRFMAKTPYRLMCTATAAPNDYIELGTHSEALGVLGQMDMLGMFFKSTDNMSHVVFKTSGGVWNEKKWVFRAHAELPFWRWVCSWARACRKPSDLGFDDDGFVLPPLEVEQITLPSVEPLPGYLIPLEARTLKEQRIERHITLQRRCEMVAELTNTKEPALIWCHSNEEGDLLEKIMPDCVQVAGKHSDEFKEQAFIDFVDGKYNRLVSKPKIAGFGLNFQHCAHETFFPSHSFEQWYQGVRRCWRFGQKKPVKVCVITTEGESGVTRNLQRKADACEIMFSKLVLEMNNALGQKIETHFNEKELAPAWL
jgi:hypothetical protein